MLDEFDGEDDGHREEGENGSMSTFARLAAQAKHARAETKSSPRNELATQPLTSLVRV